MEQPSINQIQKMMNRAQATAATANQAAIVYYSFVRQHTILFTRGGKHTITTHPGRNATVFSIDVHY